uniref:Uncharacterized protein n=1 Tax=Enterovibrio norvegicus TaxID=188144 RepID=A0A0H3ZX51_9GAMM|nr:hypothetical protein [Enterovibrio norvegicus]
MCRASVLDAFTRHFYHPFHPIWCGRASNAGGDMWRGNHGAHRSGDQGMAKPAH